MTLQELVFQLQRFWSERLYNTSVGPIRAFRMYFSPIL